MNAIRQAAQGQQCTLTIAEVCNYSTDTMVLCHFPCESHNIDFYNADIPAEFGCSDCHDVISGQINIGFNQGEQEFYMRHSQTRTIFRRIALGIIKIK